MTSSTRFLVIGATGQVGRVVVSQLVERGLPVRAVTRKARRAANILPEAAESVEADITDADSLRSVVDGIDVVILTHGGDNDLENTYYAVMPSLLDALRDRPAVHISLMTAMAHSTPAGNSWDWKRRTERLLRSSGHPYTIVRPGWFDYQGPQDTRIDMRQGDLVHGTPGVDRRHIAQLLIEGSLNPSGENRTVEVFSKPGDPITDFEALFASAVPDDIPDRGALDAVIVPLEDEPQRLREDIARFQA